MDWTFAPLDIAQGKVDYNLDDYRRDLRARLKPIIYEQCSEVGEESKERILIAICSMHYDVCYTLAIGKCMEDLVDYYQRVLPETHRTILARKEYLHDIARQIESDIPFIRGILGILVKRELGAGIPLQEIWCNLSRFDR